MASVRVFIIVANLLAAVALADPAVLLEPAVGTPTSVTVSGRVLKHAPSAGSSTVAKNLRRLTSSNWEGATVELRFAGQSATVIAGHDGDFEATLTPTPPKTFEVGLGTVEAHVVGATATATVTTISPSAPFFVISDLDDTLSVTNVVRPTALLKAALAQDESTQPVVRGMPAFYQCLQQDKPAQPAFALVSGSPTQYLERIKAFLTRNGFPVFGIALRDLGPGTLRDYKQPVIRALLARVPNPVVLVGDSGEHDPEVYRQIAHEFPGRVKAIYIRDAGHATDRARFDGQLLFAEPADAARDAVDRGLVSPECLTRAFPQVVEQAP
jgi:phosphatidate phosphatase APP1